ncbi:MAG: transcriptional regulator, TraR/DksA family protein [Chitinophaga sp.]|nr:transcriptional regulator, TraR/DksA family protein [Chitinophaga sp.]
MATKKPAPKATPKKAVKAAPAKAAAKPAVKAPAKPAAKAPAKPAAKAPAKPATKAPAKPAAKAPAKPAAKAPAKPVAPAKPAAKPAAKAPAKPAAKPAPTPAKPAVKAPPVAAKPVAPAPAPAKPAAPAKPVVKAPPAPPVKPVKKVPGPIKDVKVPKIITKSSVTYSPGYTPLEKRVEAPKPQGPLVKYNDTDLTEFRELINKKLEAAKKELAYLQGLITRKDEMGGDNDDARYMTMEDGTMSMEKEQLSQMASRQITYIDHLEKAIMRIENKTYGICRVTGRLIDKARLRAVPHATLSLEAKLGLVKPNQD